MATTETSPVCLTSCDCGKCMDRSLTQSISRSRDLQTELSQQSRQLTPPPSAAASPGYVSPRSLRPATTPEATRPSDAVIALNEAFSSEDSIPEFFPRTMSQIAERTAESSRTSSVPPRRTCLPDTEATQTQPRQSLDATRPLRCEERSPSGSSYSPMAAAFLRAAKSVHIVSSPSDQPSRGRRGSERPGLALEARLFDGPS